ncbi:kinase-like domain-containing protein, partial [Catenaria anguillulae PL171]
MSTAHQTPPAVPSSQPDTTLQQQQPLLLLDEYFLLEEVGRGSFATVHRGQSRSTLATVAVKVIPMDKLSKKLRANLNSEIAILHAMAKMSHPHIVNLIAWERHDGADAQIQQQQQQSSGSSQPPQPQLPKLRAVYLVMDWCAWGDLSQFLRTKTKRGHGTIVSETALSSIADRILGHPTAAIPREDLPLAGPWGGLYHTFTFYLLGQLVSALDFLRAHSLMHRDLKPQNLLLHPPPITSGLFPLNEIGSGATRFHPLSVNESSASSDTLRELAIGILPRLPILKLADFGFARYLPTPTSLAETLCGSPLYMAPEILRYEKYDTRADLWSVGAVLYEMLFGRVPFRAQNHVELLRKIEKYKDKLRFPKGSVPPDETSRSSSGTPGAVPFPAQRHSTTTGPDDGNGVAHSAPSAFRLPERMMVPQTAIASSPPDRSATPHRPADNRAPSPDDPEPAVSTVAPLHMLPDEMHLIMNLLRQRPGDRFSLEQFFEHKV